MARYRSFLAALVASALLYSANFTSAAPATPAGNENSVLQQASNPLFVNASSLDPTVGGMDPRFSMTIFRTTVRIDRLSMLMCSMETLSRIAQQDPKARSRSVLIRIEEFPDVTVTITPKGGQRDFAYEIAAMCLYYGVEKLASRNEFLGTTFSCRWDRFEVVRVDIDNRPRRNGQPLLLASDDNDNNDTTTAITTTTPVATTIMPNDTASNITAKGTTNSSLAATTATSNDDDISARIAFLPHGARLDLSAIILTAMNAFLNASSMPKTEIVPAKTFDAGARWDAYLALAGDGPPKTRPPFLTYAIVIEGLRQVPYMMLNSLRLAECLVTFKVGSRLLGTGTLRKGYIPSVRATTGGQSGGGGGGGEVATA
ncbi:MAG: hypothetical protein L6R37_001238 [Teloschistes peruensis]|nr:MAG: hypothetical protein L6R37_001238 [Teloschistes peruensis]